jgi:hypothetical protein
MLSVGISSSVLGWDSVRGVLHSGQEKEKKLFEEFENGGVKSQTGKAWHDFFGKHGAV